MDKEDAFDWMMAFVKAVADSDPEYFTWASAIRLYTEANEFLEAGRTGSPCPAKITDQDITPAAIR